MKKGVQGRPREPAAVPRCELAEEEADLVPRGSHLPELQPLFCFCQIWEMGFDFGKVTDLLQLSGIPASPKKLSVNI